MRSAPADALFARLPDGRGGFLDFDRPHRRELALRSAEVLPLLASLDLPSDDWRVVFVGFEGGLAAAGLATPDAADGEPPLAAIWHVAPPREASAVPPPPPTCDWRMTSARADYDAAFERAIAAILEGEIYQLNLTLRLRGADREAPTVSRAAAPPWSAWLGDPALQLWSRSPECFLEGRLDGIVQTRPIKGTAAPEDGPALRADPKEHAEHVMIVDMARNDLGRVARRGSVQVERLLSVLDVGYALHLESTVTARLVESTGLGALLAATLPAASISGTPKRAACQLISALEGSRRGPYTGVLGWLSPQGRLAFSVLIRTVWSVDGRSFGYGTGGGIVADSDPDREYAEALLKAAALGSTDGLR